MNYLFIELDCLEGALKILFLQMFNLLSPATSKPKWLVWESVRCLPSQCLLTCPGTPPAQFLSQVLAPNFPGSDWPPASLM